MLDAFDKYLFSDFWKHVITVDNMLYFPLEETCVLIVRSFIFCTFLVTCGFILAELIGTLIRWILDFIHDRKHEGS